MTDKFNNTKIEREGPLNRYNFTDFFQGFDQVPIIKQTFGENVVEISCHGSSYVQNEIIKLSQKAPLLVLGGGLFAFIY